MVGAGWLREEGCQKKKFAGPPLKPQGGRGSEIPFQSATSSSGWRSSDVKILPSLVEPLPELPLCFSGVKVPLQPPQPQTLFTWKKGREQGLLWLGQAVQRDPAVRRDWMRGGICVGGGLEEVVALMASEL